MNFFPKFAKNTSIRTCLLSVDKAKQMFDSITPAWLFFGREKFVNIRNPDSVTLIEASCSDSQFYAVYHYKGFAFFTVIFAFSGTLVIQVRTRLPSSMTSHEEQDPCLQLNDRRNPDLTQARLSGCPELIWIVFPLSRFDTDTCKQRICSLLKKHNACLCGRETI